MLLGSHLSIAGGLSGALVMARKYGFPVLAIFVRNQRQWACRPLDEEEAAHFRALRRELGIVSVIAHGSYLLNLCGSDVIRRKSIEAVAEDLRRCGRLGVDALVIHPGSHADVETGVRLIADGLNQAVRLAGDDNSFATNRASLAVSAAGPEPRRANASGRRDAAAPVSVPMVLLETTSGAGHSIGGRFEQIAQVLALLEAPQRFGVCMDTCHIFAAGYDIRSPEAYADTMGRFDAVIGLERLKAIHVNDSKGDLASRLDRHEHIGKGRIGLQGFANFVRDGRLAAVPLILETPKGKDSRGRDWDRVNARTLRGLCE